MRSEKRRRLQMQKPKPPKPEPPQRAIALSGRLYTEAEVIAISDKAVWRNAMRNLRDFEKIADYTAAMFAMRNVLNGMALTVQMKRSLDPTVYREQIKAQRVTLLTAIGHFQNAADSGVGDFEGNYAQWEGIISDVQDRVKTFLEGDTDSLDEISKMLPNDAEFKKVQDDALRRASTGESGRMFAAGLINNMIQAPDSEYRRRGDRDKAGLDLLAKLDARFGPMSMAQYASVQDDPEYKAWCWLKECNEHPDTLKKNIEQAVTDYLSSFKSKLISQD